MGDQHNSAFQHTERYESVFSVIFSIISESVCHACEHSLGIGKVEPVFCKVCLSFVFVPCEFHNLKINLNYGLP